MKKDYVNPDHYKALNREVVIDDKKLAINSLDFIATFDFLRGNLFKYILRRKLKGEHLKDLNKAKKYLNTYKVQHDNNELAYLKASLVLFYLKDDLTNGTINDPLLKDALEFIINPSSKSMDKLLKGIDEEIESISTED